MLGWSLITFSENSLFAIVYSTHYTLAVVALEMTGFVRTSRNATMRRAMSRHLSFSLLSDEPHQLIWQQHMCGTLGVSPLECEVVGQSYKTLYFHYQHPPSWNDPSKSVAQKNKTNCWSCCPIHWPAQGLHGLTVLDDETIEWLLNTCQWIVTTCSIDEVEELYTIQYTVLYAKVL